VQWVLANKTVTSPIIGASRPEQLADAVLATQSPMSPDIKKRIDELTHDYRFVDDARW
jgi:aryl-alcohol dehydrogenase-like predicted oxidoreductase